MTLPSPIETRNRVSGRIHANKRNINRIRDGHSCVKFAKAGIPVEKFRLVCRKHINLKVSNYYLLIYASKLQIGFFVKLCIIYSVLNYQI